MRLIGVMEHATEVPGVPDYETKFAPFYGVKVIAVTSDVYRDSLELQRGMFYQSYAKNYNRFLLDI